MAKKQNDSTLARLSLAKDNEDLVLAENSLYGERLVSIVRVIVIVLIFLSVALAMRIKGVEATERNPVRAFVSLGYLVLSVGNLIVLRRQKPNARAAFWVPFVIMFVDYAFFSFMGWLSVYQGEAFTPQNAAAVYALLIAFSMARFSPLHVFVATGLSNFGYMLLGMTYAPQQVQQHLFVLAILTAFGFLTGMTQRRIRKMFLDLRRRDMLTRFLPKQVAERVMTLGDTSLAPTQREVTVMFTDIRDFTTMSESLPPSAVLSFLDEYFGHMTQLVKAHDGIVNKFLGDGLLAFWGVPERLENHAESALRTALDMRKVVEELNQVRKTSGAPPFRIGIGIHTGTVAAGMLGGAEQHEYTVIGDAVNLTSRIEGLTKSYGVDVLVSHSTWEQVKDRFVGERIGECHVKGRAEPVVVYRLDALRSASSPVRAEQGSPTVLVSARG